MPGPWPARAIVRWRGRSPALRQTANHSPPRLGTALWSTTRSTTASHSARPGPRWPSSAWARPRTSGPCLRHSADPSLRSYIVNWLNPLGADPKTVADQLKRRDYSPRLAQPEAGDRTRLDAPRAVNSQGDMSAVLFHPETSTRRALILALGTYRLEGLSPGDREPLVTMLLNLHRDDPDAGIHAAAEWTLRKWGKAMLVNSAALELTRLQDRPNLRWFVNRQRQTFALIEGPVEFQMGSPPTKTERNAADRPRGTMVIPRRYAIATREVTVSQFQWFLSQARITLGRYRLATGNLQKYSPDPDGPWLAPQWYVAAHYCNWLSEQEGIPTDQWCYIPAPGGAYDEGMTAAAS